MAVIEFNIPSRILFGADSISQLASVAGRYGGRAILLTDGGSFNHSGIIEKLVDTLKAGFINVIVFSDIASDSSSELADTAAHIASFGRADVIIAIGGFRVQNIAKAAAVVVTNSGEASDYVSGQPVYHKPMPLISVPTILGSLSEITTGLCLYDKYDKVNKQTISSGIYASDCIIDPNMYSTVPVKYVVSSAISVFALAFDLYMSRSLTIISDTLVSRSIRLSMRALSKILGNTGNIDNFTGLVQANMLCAVSACHSKLGAVRAIAIAMNSVFGTNMSMFISIILPHVMEYYITAAPDKYSSIGRAIGGMDEDMSPFEIATKSAQYIRQYLQNINLPTRLSEFNINNKRFGEVATIALNYPGISDLPRAMTYDSIVMLLEQAY